MSKAFVFPGQGSQKIGMGKSLADNFPVAKEVFNKVDEALGEKLSGLTWEGNIDELTLTKNAQPALMATSMAVLAVLEDNGFDINSLAFVAGHSLGEYTALCASRSIDIADCARLLRTRGLAMQESVISGQGSMAAILGLDLQQVETVITDVQNSNSDKKEICQIANDNDPKQVVISGNTESITRAVELAKDKGAKRAVILQVSAPFHCDLMAPAANAMEKALSTIDILKPKVPVILNTTARPSSDPIEIKQNLVKQVTGRVEWRESINIMVKNGVTEFYEIGVGRVLSGTIKRISANSNAQGLSTEEDIGNYLGARRDV